MYVCGEGGKVAMPLPLKRKSYSSSLFVIVNQLLGTNRSDVCMCKEKLVKLIYTNDLVLHA